MIFCVVVDGLWSSFYEIKSTRKWENRKGDTARIRLLKYTFIQQEQKFASSDGNAHIAYSAGGKAHAAGLTGLMLSGQKAISKAIGLQQTTARAIIHKWKKLETVITVPSGSRPTLF